MTDPDHRCSILSLRRAEPMLGTAFAQGGLLLVEQPGAWGRTGLADSDFDHRVAESLERRAAAEGLRVFAIRRPGRTAGDAVRHWALRPAGSAVTLWGTYAAEAELLDLALDGSAGDPDAGPLFLVCTHSRRDECCAVYGRPVADALEAVQPGRVWGCSHTGGHRFAPVVLTVPAGVAGAALHGRIGPEDVPALVAATEAGRTLPEHLRGQIGHPPQVQAALAFAQRESGHAGYGDWSVSGEPQVGAGGAEVGAGEAEVELEGPVGRVRVRVTMRVDPTPYPSCGKPGPEPQTHYQAHDFHLLTSH